MSNDKEQEQEINENLDSQEASKETEIKSDSEVETETEANADENADVVDENAELEKTKEQLADMQDSYLRLRAEFDNYKKRTIKEKAELIKSAGESVFLNIIPLLDDFERGIQAAENASDVDSIKDGMNLIYDKFVKFLDQNGVKEIDTKDKVFDTDFHEAITTMPAQSDDQKGKVVDCVQKGYTLNDKVIRFAKVVVAQ